jgi:hypothetical protein
MSNTLRCLALGASLLVVAGCSVEIDGKTGDSAAKVNIASPVGSLSARTDVDPSATGLPAYPGARLLRDGHDDSASAEVLIGGPAFGLRLVAASFESSDGENPIVDFYRRELQRFGTVIECHGELKFDHDGDSPACRQRASRMDLAVGRKNDHRVVSITPRGSGSKIGIIHIQAGK